MRNRLCQCRRDQAFGGAQCHLRLYDQPALGWGCWPSQYFALSRDTTASPDGKCLKIRYFGDPAQGAPIFYASSTYSLDSAHVYRLRFSAKKDHASPVHLLTRIAASPYTVIGLDKTIMIDTSWTDFEMFFAATMSNANCRVDFYMTKTDTLAWIDNVSLFEIDRSNLNSELRSRLFCNASGSVQSYSLGSDIWRDVPGVRGISASISLQPFMSQILIKDSLASTNAPRLPSRSMDVIGLRALSFGRDRVIVTVPFQSVASRVTLVDCKGRLLFEKIVGPGDSNGRALILPRISGGLSVLTISSSGRSVSRRLIIK